MKVHLFKGSISDIQDAVMKKKERNKITRSKFMMKKELGILMLKISIGPRDYQNITRF